MGLRSFFSTAKAPADYNAEALGVKILSLVEQASRDAWQDGDDLNRVDVVITAFGEVRLVYRREHYDKYFGMKIVPNASLPENEIQVRYRDGTVVKFEVKK